MTGSMLLERLARGPILCAEGYLFELERRGFLQAGAYVPEVVLDHPGEVEDLLEPLNRGALEIAARVARETGALLAGDVCNTNVYFDEPEVRRTVRAMFDE